MLSSQRLSTHILSPHSTTWKKICTDKTHTHTPETENNTPPTNSTDQVHIHKKESSIATQRKQSKQTEEPVVPKIKWNTDSIELNGKVHKLPITKAYILQE